MPNSKPCLLTKAPTGFAFVHQPKHILVTLNPRFEELMSCSLRTGQSLYEAVPQRTGLLEALDQAYALGGSFCLPQYELGPGARVDIRIEPSDTGLLILLQEPEVDSHALQIQTQLSLALESAHSGVWWVDLATDRVVASRETAKIYGRDEINMSLDESLSALVHELDQAMLKEKIVNSAREQTLFHAVFRSHRADGSSGWVESHGRVICDAEGQPTSMIGVQSDITAQKLTAMNLEMEKAKLESIFQASPAGMALWRGADLILEKYNPACEICLQSRTGGDRPFREIFPEFHNQPFEGLLLQVYRTGVPLHAREMPAYIVVREGEPPVERHFDFSYAQIKDWEGLPYGVYVHFQDVSDRVIVRKELEANQHKLRQVESLLRKAIAVARMGYFDWNIRENTLAISEQMQSDWGITGELTTMEDALMLVHSEDRRLVDQKIQRAVETQTPYFARHRIVRPDNGAITWIEAQGEANYDDEGQPTRVFGTSVDITERKANEQALQEARLEAERANSAKSTFLANMSHEIRSPLGAIMGYSDILKSGSLTPEEIAHFIAAIDRNSHHLLRIIDDILDLSKVEAGKVQIESIDFSMPALLSDLLSLMELKAHEKGIDFSLQIPDPIPDHVISDPTRIRQILSNVVGNAIKFTERGRVQLLVTCEGCMLEFRVTDTGPGISKEQEAQLFQPFHQADVSTTRRFGGTGLGLILTRRLAEAMQGSFELEQSIPGRGSTFVARVRVDRPADCQMIDGKNICADVLPKPAISNPSHSLQGLHILVVEDSPDNQFLFDHVLSTAGAKVDIAQDGYEGLHMALLNPYDAILMDVQMPRMDGHEATKTLRRKGLKLPIIALTAHAMKEEKQRSLLTGFTDFLSKPVPHDVLIAMILRYQKKVSRRPERRHLN